VIYAEDNVVVFVRVYKQQRVLVAINRGEACEVVIEDSPLLDVGGWTLQEGAGAFHDGVLTLPAISASVWSGR
jgi:alpha-glucosidase